MKIDEESWNAGGKYSALELKEATRSSVMVLLKDMFFVRVSRKGYKLYRGDFKHLSVRYIVLIFSLLVLHYHHHRETMLDKMQ
jgi:hypothetical protein